MKRFLLALGLTTLAWSAPKYHQKFSLDLTGDGRPEQVVLAYYRVGEVQMGQLQVIGPAGKVLWASPKVKEAYSDSPWSFLGEFDLGDICWIDDYDKDGDIDLCATCQKSDVSPTQFRLYHWDGKRFIYDQTSNLSAAPQKPATFEWTAPKPDLSAWVNSMKKVGPGLFKLEFLEIPRGSQTFQVRYRPGEGFVLAN
jgi:hypothetical protein